MTTEPDPLDNETMEEYLEHTEALLEKIQGDKLALIHPSPKQVEIWACQKRFWYISGANQFSGKTTARMIAVQFHMSGDYPVNWPGKRFDGPVTWLYCSETAKVGRDVITDRLFGPIDDRGSGLVPAETLVKGKLEPARQGLIGQVDRWYQPHRNGGRSVCFFLSYEMKDRAIRGFPAPDGIDCDEEMARESYLSELISRLGVSGGCLCITGCPKDGETAIWASFRDELFGRWMMLFDIDDVKHKTEQEISDWKAIWRGHRDEAAVLHGLPPVGEGAVFRADQRNYAKEVKSNEDSLLELPGLLSIDIPGTTGKMAILRTLYDEAIDRIYFDMEYLDSEQPLAVYFEQMRRMGQFPINWPQDALRGTGMEDFSSFADQMRRARLKVLDEPAGIMDLDGERKRYRWAAAVRDFDDRMRTGRVWIDPVTCRQLLSQLRTYRQKDSVPIRGQKDDLVDAALKAIVMAPHFSEEWDDPLGEMPNVVTNPGQFDTSFDFFKMGQKR